MVTVASALVVGGGPAGLSAAIALRQADVDRVQVVELTDGNGPIGSELSIAGPMLRALDALGAADRCAADGVGIEQATFRNVAGEVTHTIPFPPPHRQGLPPTVGITRPRLHAILTERALSVGATLERGVSVDALDQRDRGVDVSLTDGTSDSYDLVVGADGVASRLRSYVSPLAPRPEFVGQAAWRARVPRDGLEPMLTVLNGPSSKSGLITVSAEYAYVFCLVTVPRFERIVREDFPQRLREQLAEFGGPIARLRDAIVNPDHIHYSPLTPLIVDPPWHRGRVLLIGDAVHATTPHLAYGAGLAVEDGLVLGDTIAHHDDLDAALVAFTERRYERCRMVVANGVQLSHWEQRPDDPAADFMGLSVRSFTALAEPI